MRKTKFVIKTLDFGRVSLMKMMNIYCAEELEIPQERIEEVECFDNAFNRSRSYFHDDWYVNLQRIESQSA